MAGFIKIYRDALDSDLLYKPALLQVWMYLNKQARYVRTVQDGIEILPGQLLLTAAEVAQACRLQEDNVRYAFSCLEKRKLIRRENIRNRYSLITLLDPSEKQTKNTERSAPQPARVAPQPPKPTPPPKPQYDRNGLANTASYDLEAAEKRARESVPTLTKRKRTGF